MTLEEICNSSLHFVEGVDFLNHFCSIVYKHLHLRKPALNDARGFRGNIAMMQCASITNESFVAATLVNDHFFAIEDPMKQDRVRFPMYISASKLYLNSAMDGGPNRLKVCISQPKQECFLYLGCWGGFDEISSQCHSVVSEFLELLTENASLSLSRPNSGTMKSSCNELEVAAHIAVMAASHINGFRGVKGFTFLEELLKESTPMKNATRSIVGTIPKQLKLLMDNITIPYLGPDGHEWPESLLTLPGVRAASYYRVGDLMPRSKSFSKQVRRNQRKLFWNRRIWIL